MSGGPLEQSNEQTLQGAWLRQERTRLALSRPFLAERLGVPLRLITIVETKAQPVPSAWLETLKGLGFRVVLAGEPQEGPSPIPTASVEEGAAAGAEGGRERAHEAKQGFTGAWLRSFCREHRISLSQISDCLDVPFKTVLYYEQRDRPLPAWWVTKIQPLASHQPESTDLVQVIIDYRLRFGRLAEQSAVEVLAWIAHDLRASGAEQSVSFTDIEEALATLQSSRRSRFRSAAG